ncbi:MAG: FAD-binding protein, partial [Rhodospirillales bacterium]|nr:FAD-binding protein [Acetobacter sp.]
MEPTTPLEPAGTNAFASRTNWAGNYAYGASEFAESGSEAALRKSLASTKAAKAVGSRHSFNHIADTSGTQISTSLLKAMTLDVATCTVTIGAGVTYGELAPFLDREGFALQNLASLPHISVAGACSTGTHGSGLENGCLSTAVRAVNIVRADGACITLSRESDPEVFPYAVINLGALGVITTMTLEVVPAFRVAQTVFENLSLDVLEKQLPEVFG